MHDVDVEPAVERMATFLSEQLAAADAEGYVVGVSGGLDSAVAATLAVDAVGPGAVTGLVLPGEPTAEANTRDASDLCADLGIEHHEVDIAPIVERFEALSPDDHGRLVLGNVRARVRMTFEYLEANATDRLVLGPTNRSELLLGYFTKYGDGGADVRPMADLYKSEMGDVARALGVDERFLRKPPSAELWEGQTDEEELGATYGTIDTVLKSLVEAGRSVEAAAERAGVPVEEARRFQRMMESTEHKREVPPYPELPR